jgi:hypothetical protein
MARTTGLCCLGRRSLPIVRNVRNTYKHSTDKYTQFSLCVEQTQYHNLVFSTDLRRPFHSHKDISTTLLGWLVDGTHPLLITEAQFRSHGTSCEVCGVQNVTRTDYSPSTSLFRCQYHSTIALYSILPRRRDGSRYDPTTWPPALAKTTLSVLLMLLLLCLV